MVTGGGRITILGDRRARPGDVCVRWYAGAAMNKRLGGLGGASADLPCKWDAYLWDLWTSKLCAGVAGNFRTKFDTVHVLITGIALWKRGLWLHPWSASWKTKPPFRAHLLSAGYLILEIMDIELHIVIQLLLEIHIY